MTRQIRTGAPKKQCLHQTPKTKTQRTLTAPAHDDRKTQDFTSNDNKLWTLEFAANSLSLLTNFRVIIILIVLQCDLKSEV